MDISSEYTLADCARFKAERDALAQRMEEIASEIDRTMSGVEGIEDAPALRWMRGLREALGALHSQRISYDDIEAAKWVRDHGGLDEVNRKVAESMQQADEYIALRCSLAERAGDLYEMLDKEDDELVSLLDKRLMPEGMEWLFDVWPKWSNGEYCKFGDWWKAEKYGEREPQQLCRLVFFTPEQLREWGQDEGENFGYEWDYMRPRDTTYRPDKVEPPEPKVLDADGVEIRVGDTVYHVKDGSEMTVYGIEGEWLVVSVGGRVRHDIVTHRAPVLAAAGRTR